MRYILGIDLGTTNSCLCFVDTQDPKLSVQLFRIPQVQRLGYTEALPTLPSFCFSGAPQPLPWKKDPLYDVGAFAREEGAKTPTKLVESAKSWLCHKSINRYDRLLPLEAANENDRISPVEASARYLRHIKDAWNHVKAKNDKDAFFEEQDIVLTVPASFDESARALTVEAAKLAGIKQLTLLEEPQAAFYSWIAQHENSWKEILKAGDSVLVCDVGGGTTDFSLIDVHAAGEDLALRRMAVGDHLLLGGDNMDIAIAHYIEQKLFGEDKRELSINQWLQLKHQARKAKEALLDAKSEDKTFRVLLQGTGSSVVAQTLSAELEKNLVHGLLKNGFYPMVDWASAANLIKSSGVKSVGLPYEAEPAITKHLAAFLRQSNEVVKAPDFVLFNGGAMKPPEFQNAIIDSLKSWFPHSQPKVLDSYHLDLAVGRGAAYYGRVRRGLGVRIGGGSASGFYLGVGVSDADGVQQTKALTLLPRGSEEGDRYEPSQLFTLKPNTPIAFTLYHSHVRLHDQSGDLVEVDAEEMRALPPIQTILRFGKSTTSDQAITVRLGIALSAVGTLELWLQSEQTSHRWDLEFQLRSSEGKERTAEIRGKDETFDAQYLTVAKETIEKAFSGQVKMDRLMETLEGLLEKPRREWSPSVLRGLWESVLLATTQRKMTSENETRWWNLAGFMLRPGFGYPLDDFRIKEFWKVVLADFKAVRLPEADIQRWICLRRVAAGLSRGQQTQVAGELWPQLIDKQTNKILIKGKGDTYQYSEKLRTAASFELVEQTLKIKLGNAILARIAKEEALPVELWALGRLGARQLFHGSTNHVISRDVAAEWIEKLILQKTHTEQWLFAVSMIARKTDQRELNITQVLVKKLLATCDDETKQRLKTLLTEAIPLSQNEQDKVFGEQLPPGLIMQL